MTELAVRNTLNGHAELSLVDRADAAIARLTAWAAAAQATYKMAENLVQTSFVPEAFRGKPMEATAAMLAGAEVGLNPMASLRSFDVIQGTAAPRANTLRAIVQGAGHEIRVVEATSTRAVVTGRRRGERDWQQSVWPIERAAKLKLTGKDNWQKQPQAMLVARATAECCRLVAMDAILGIPYAAEELADDIESGAAAPEAKPKTRRMQRAPVAPPEPELEEPATENGDDDPISQQQMRLMQKLFTDAGITEAQDKRDYCTQQLGRNISSVGELSKWDANKVIDALTPVEEPPFDEGWPPAATPPSEAS
jgi:hypothetical protein